MARLSFQNVPTKSGGVVSGNISTGAGSPFGSGGKYEAQVAGIKAEIAKKPEGYYDPPPNVLWDEENPVIRTEIEEVPKVMEAREILGNLYATQKTYNFSRFSSEGEKLAMQFKIDKQNKIIDDHYNQVLAEKNAPILQAREDQKAQEAEFLRKMETELWIQQALDKHVINQRPILEAKFQPKQTDQIETEPTSSLPIIPIIIIAVIVGIFLLRRRA